jgi:SAM-dependent methyltransferase
MTRWSRAAHLLDLPTRSRVLDLGCAFGFGTRMLVPRYETYGHDLDACYIARARKSVPLVTFTLGPASDVPYHDRFFDGVVLLDVLEHVPDDGAVVREVARLLRPGGRLVLSVPNTGLLAAWDSLNVYTRLVRSPRLAPTNDPSWAKSPNHRHYSLEQILDLLGDDFSLSSVQYTGLGVAEPVNLLLLLAFRGLLRIPRLYNALQYLYFTVYMTEDLLPTGRWGYHMMLTAERT